MAVDSKHPLWELFNPIWTTMRDAEAGEEAVKDKNEEYLPKPSGFNGQADGGSKMYEAYKKRAQFPDILQPTLAGMVGVIHRVDANVTGLEEGKPLAYMWEKCTRDDQLPLEVFHRRITSEILLMGRYSIFTDVPSGDDPNVNWEVGLPYFVGYGAEQLINWSEFERDLYVLDESRKVRGNDEFAWEDEKRFRVLRRKNGAYTVQVFAGEQVETGGPLISPMARAAKTIQEIPLVVVGPRELSSRIVEQPPLKGVAKASMAIYRLDADYRHQLFNTGQETLFVIGSEDTPKVVGSGVVIGLPIDGSAMYVGPKGIGISAHRQAIMDARQDANAAGVKLFDTQSKAESGEALRLRSSAQTATLTSIAQTSAAALERALRYAAVFVGQDPEEIVVKPNLQFVDTKMSPQEAGELVTVWQSGAISKQTLYENLQKGEIASSERTFEEEQELISQEEVDDPMALGKRQDALSIERQEPLEEEPQLQE